jgi:Flp pilus assembly protein TadG
MIVRRREAGQNLVEFSLVMMFLLIVAFGVLDLGRAFFSIITISNAAREGARYLTTHSKDNLSSFYGTKTAVAEEAQGSIFNIQADEINVVCVDSDDTEGCDSGTAVRVTVNYEFNPIMGWIIQGPISLSRSVEMIMP